MQAEHRATTETLQAAIASLQHKATNVPPVQVSVSSQPAPINNPAIVLPTPGTSSGTSTVKQGPTVRTAVTSTPAASNDTALTLEGQPPIVTSQPNDLANDPTPIKTLRRDDSTGDAAAIILNGAGLAKMTRSEPKVGFPVNLVSLKIKKPSGLISMFLGTRTMSLFTIHWKFLSSCLVIYRLWRKLPQSSHRTRSSWPTSDYLRQLMDDVGSMDWESVRAVHRQVLMAMELHRIKWDTRK